MIDLNTPVNEYLRKQLEKRLTMQIDDFKALGDVRETADGPVIHIDNGGSVLGVAHLDWVLWRKPTISKDKHTVYCPQLDDRLGVWVILDLLPTLYGIKYDILLTDSEEVGKSTAKDFTDCPKAYNWMFQFDRRGTDTVLYRYDSKQNRERLEKCGLTTGSGSFSDICYLDHLGVSGWNVGTGYYGEHTQACHGKLKETRSNAHKFHDFFLAHQNEKIEAPAYSEPVYYYGNYSTKSRSSAWDWGDDYYGYYDSPTYKAEKESIIRAYSDPSRRYDEDWACSCGKVNYWDADYCADCGDWFNPDRQYDGYEVIDLDDVPPFGIDHIPRRREPVTLEDFDMDRETFAQFVLRTGYTGRC